MIKPSSITKSKREQLDEKKIWKREKTSKREIRVIDLDSDLDDPKEVKKDEPEAIDLDKVEKIKEDVVVIEQSPKAQQFNKFNYVKLTKIAPVVVDDPPLLVRDLGVVVDEGRIDDKERDAFKAFTFYVEGSKQQYNVRKILLKDKSLVPLSRLSKPTEEPSKETKEPSDEKEDELAERKNRYFQISHEMCFRCGKQGHYAKNCVEEDNRKCKTCFSRQHDERNCPQVCYECGAVGHISSECPQNRRDRCDRCQKRGHSTDCCGVIMNDKTSLSRPEDIFIESDLKKMKCIMEETQNHQKTEHHFNCFEYKDWPMPYHELRKPNKSETIRNVYVDNSRDRQRRYQPENSYRTGNTEQDRAYNHYRERYQREFANEEREERRGWGQNRSFSHSERWERGQTPPNRDQRGRQNANNSNRKRSKNY